MKLIKKSKKGFTLVELIVVIAIVAILAAVSVVSYLAFINQANLSADQQAITQMNKIVQADKILNDYEYAGDAVQALYRNGYNVGKLKTFSNNYSYGYSLENNKWYLLDNNTEVVYPDNNVSKDTLWLFYGNQQNNVKNGIIKYIAADNVISSEHFNNGFASTTTNYTLDLNGYYIAVNSALTNVTIVNGLQVSGGTAGEAIDASRGKAETGVNYSTQPTSEEAYYVVKDLILNCNEVKINSIIGISNEDTAKKNPLKFLNCIFFNADNYFGSSVTDGDRYFEDCTFVNSSADTYVISAAKDLMVKNCTFTNIGRGINLIDTYYVDTYENGKQILIEGNTFNCLVKKVFIQFGFAKYDVDSNNNPTLIGKKYGYNNTDYTGDAYDGTEGNGKYDGHEVEYKNTVTIKNNNFLSLGTGEGLVRVHDSIGERATESDVSLVNNITFSNNKVDSSIPNDKKVIDDDNRAKGKWTQNGIDIVNKLMEKFN